MKNIFASITDAIFYSIVFLIVIFCVIAKVGGTLFLCLAVAISCAIALFFLFLLTDKHKRKVFCNASIKKKTYEQIIYQLTVISTEKVLITIANAINELGISATICGNYISTKLSNIYPFFLPETMNCNMLTSIIKETTVEKDKKTIILSTEFSPSAIIFAEKSNITLIDIKGLSNILATESIKQILITEQPQKKVSFSSIIKDKASKIFKRNYSKRFVLYGLFLIVMSFAVFYPIYYQISGSAFIIFGFLCRFVAPLKCDGKTDLIDIIKQ